MTDATDCHRLLELLINRRLRLVSEFARDPEAVSDQDFALLGQLQAAIGAVEAAQPALATPPRSFWDKEDQS